MILILVWKLIHANIHENELADCREGSANVLSLSVQIPILALDICKVMQQKLRYNPDNYSGTIFLQLIKTPHYKMVDFAFLITLK